jgi:hypothetical protein
VAPDQRGDVTKKCVSCGAEKVLDDFETNRSRPDGRGSFCRECSRARARSWKRSNPERARATSNAWAKSNPDRWEELMRRGRERYELRAAVTFRDADRTMYLSKRYKFTIDEYDRLLARQRNLCAICEVPHSTSAPLHVDADRDSAVVRGLLCHSCIEAVRLMRDDPSLLDRAVQYLRRSHD